MRAAKEKTHWSYNISISRQRACNIVYSARAVDRQTKTKQDKKPQHSDITLYIIIGMGKVSARVSARVARQSITFVSLCVCVCVCVCVKSILDLAVYIGNVPFPAIGLHCPEAETVA